MSTRAAPIGLATRLHRWRRLLVVGTCTATALTAGGTAVAAPAAHPGGTAAVCGELVVNMLRDRTVLSGSSLSGATSHVIQRENVGGAWVTLGSTSSGAFTDRRSNPARSRTYRVLTGSASCTTASGLSDGAATGLGLPDFVVGSAEGTSWSQQDTDGAATALTNFTGPGMLPAYSPDGQWIAAAVDSAGTWIVELRRANGEPSSEDADFSLGDEQSGGQAFSPNGRYLAVSEYNATSSELAYIDLFGARTLVPVTDAVDGRGVAWLPDNQTVVVSQLLDPGSPTTTVQLARENVFTGVHTLIAKTENGSDPNVASDGTIVYAESNTNLGEVSPDGDVGTWFVGGDGSFDVYEPKVTSDLLHTYFESVDTFENNQPPPIIKIDNLTRDGAVHGTRVGLAVGDSSGKLDFDVRTPPGAGTSDLTGDNRNDVLAKSTGGQLYVYPQAPAGSSDPLGARRSLGRGWNIYRSILAAGDLNSDGIGDILGQTADGDVYLYAGTRTGLPGARVLIATGTQGDLLIAVGDWDGDGHADLLARTSSGDLELFRGTGTGGGAGTREFPAPVVINHGWGSFTAIVGVGDLNYDNSPDLVARTSSGQLLLYANDGAGGIRPGHSLGWGWNSVSQLNGPEFFDGEISLLARSGSKLIRYGSSGDGALAAADRKVLGGGWTGLAITS